MENKPATTIRILNADILDITRDELLRRLDRGVLVTPNVDHLVKLQSDPEFLRIYRQAEWVVCDSKIIQIMSRMLRRPFPGSHPRKQLLHRILPLPQRRPRLPHIPARRRRRRGPQSHGQHKPGHGPRHCGGSTPPPSALKNDEECRGITEIINRSGATVVLVGVGAPKQEKWIDRWKEQMPGVRLWMALGATIDFGPAPPAARSHGIPQNRHGVVLPFRQRTPAALPPIFHRRHEIFHILHPPASRVIQRSFCIILIF